MSGFIDQVVNVQISAAAATPSLPGTDIPAIAAYHTHNTDLSRTYSDTTGMIADGFTTTEPAYLMAASLIEQNPRPATFKVIRLTTAVQQLLHFKVTDTNVGDNVGLTLTNASGVTTDVQHVVTTGQTAAQIATALAAITVTGATLAIDGGDNTQVDITITASGVQWGVSNVFGGTLTDATPSASVATDLANQILFDNSWYGLTTMYKDATNVAAIAAWTETNGKIFFYQTLDTAVTAGNTGVFNTLKSSAYQRSVGLFNDCGVPTAANSNTYPATGWIATELVNPAGSDTAAYKTIIGSAVSTLSTTQIANIQNNNGNFYIAIAGLNKTIDGRAASGIYIDLIHGIDGLSRDIQVAVFAAIANAPRKLPYTRKGIAIIKGAVQGVLQEYVHSGFLSGDSGFEPVVTVPDIANVSQADKTARILRNVSFIAFAQGAIQTVKIVGVVST